MTQSLLLTMIALIGLGLTGGSTAAARTAEDGQGKPKVTDASRGKLDRSGKKQFGKASFYARKFTGRKMADGTPMNPRDDNAASKTLPLGTAAKVTNLETGQSTMVTIQDRGPYVPGRVVDLSPASAEQIGLTRQEGIARVEVAPVAVPLPDGSVKQGAGAK
jgi:rare lipoprotein A